MVNKQPKESLERKSAYEYYYSLGKDRSLTQVSAKVGKARCTIANWSKWFKWQKRVEARDQVIAKQLEKKVDNEIINTKANYRKEIKQNLNIIKLALRTALVKVGDGFKSAAEVEEVRDLSALVTAYERLVKLDLQLLGEPDVKIGLDGSFAPTKIEIIAVNVEKNNEPKANS